MFSLNSLNSVTTRMHSSRMHTACSSSCPGGSPPGTSPRDQALPPEQTHLPWDQAPPTGAGTLLPPPPVDRITDACKNICHHGKTVQTCYLLCQRLGCSHSTCKKDVRDRIFELTLIHASMIYQIP